MKLSFLFWNLRGGQGPSLLGSIARMPGHGIDVFLFAECPPEPALLLSALNGEQPGPYYRAVSLSERVQFYSNLQGVTWIDRSIDPLSDRLTVQELQSDTMIGALIVGAHLDPANYLSPDDRAEWAREVAADIRRLE